MFLESYEMHDGEEMFEPVFAENGEADRSHALENARSDVSHMKNEFNDCLREDDMGRDELESVDHLLRAGAQNPHANSRKIAKESAKLLEKVETKLKTAASDLQRFDGESMAGSVSTGKQAHRLTRAATALHDAKEKLEKLS